MRLRLTLLFPVLALALLSIGGVRQTYKNRSQNISLTPLMLEPGNAKRDTVGALTFLAAWELRSDNEQFGGISGLVALDDGRFLGISDAGALIGFGLSNDARINRPFIAALPGAFGRNIGFRERDSEGMARDPTTGRIWVSYEQRHSIRRFPPSVSRVDGIMRLPGTREWRDNQGVEAIARMADGRFLLFAEGGTATAFPAFFYSGDPLESGSKRMEFRFQPPAGYRPTDAAPLPDGRILILLRRIGFPNGFSAKLGVIDPADIARGETLSAAIIASLAPPLLIDNMEGLAITQDQGHTIIWLVSDNNFNIFQRTLLMKFRLNLAPNKKPEAKDTPGFDSL